MSDSQQMNDDIRRRGRRGTATTEARPSAETPAATPGTPPGNAGNGTASYPEHKRLTMSDIIRAIAKGWLT